MRKLTSFLMACLMAMSASTVFAAGPMWGNGPGMNRGNNVGMYEGYGPGFGGGYGMHHRHFMRGGYGMAQGQRSTASMTEMHKLMTAPKFDEAAVRKQIESMEQQNRNLRVERARLNHDRYQQLTPEQKAQVEQNFQQRMQYFQQIEKTATQTQ